MVSGKTLKMLVLFACAAALSLGLSACKKESAEQPEDSNLPVEVNVPLNVDVGTEPGQTPGQQPTVTVPAGGSMDIVPLVGVGSVTFGMTKEQVIEQLGEPDKMEAGGIALFYPQSHGLSLVLEYGGGVKEIDCWSDQHPMKPPDIGITTYAGKTAEGIAIGSSRTEVIAAYGQPDSTTSKGPLETLTYDQLKASFELLQDKLVRMKLQAP